MPRVVLVVMLVCLLGPAPLAGSVQAVEPVTRTVRFPAPGKHVATVEAFYPTDGRASMVRLGGTL